MQYFKFLGRLLHGDLGESYDLQRPVTRPDQDNAPYTIQLAIAAVLIELLGIPLGIYSALRQYTFWDTRAHHGGAHHLGHPRVRARRSSCSGSSASSSTCCRLPVTAPATTCCGSSPPSWASSVASLILPAVTLGLIEVAYISYMQRASMLEVIRTDYVRTARAKGLSERQVITRHAFKNAVIPVMTIAGIDLGALMGGAILTETVFNRARASAS